MPGGVSHLQVGTRDAILIYNKTKQTNKQFILILMSVTSSLSFYLKIIDLFVNKFIHIHFGHVSILYVWTKTILFIYNLSINMKIISFIS